jgi:hypothetical protein
VGEAPEAVIGRITRAWWGPETDGVMATAELDATPRARTIERGMRAIHARGILSDFVGISIVAQVRFSIRPGSHPLPIHGVDAVHAVDLVTYPAAGGWMIRPLTDDEDPTVCRPQRRKKGPRHDCCNDDAGEVRRASPLGASSPPPSCRRCSAARASGMSSA